MLIENQSLVYDHDRYQRTALHYACLYGYHSLVRVLIDFGSNISSEEASLGDIDYSIHTKDPKL